MKNNLGRDPVVIIGAGVAGLTAANLLARNGFTVTIFEASNKLGGCCAQPPRLMVARSARAGSMTGTSSANPTSWLPGQSHPPDWNAPRVFRLPPADIRSLLTSALNAAASSTYLTTSNEVLVQHSGHYPLSYS
jgi:monoamine oxidase